MNGGEAEEQRLTIHVVRHTDTHPTPLRCVECFVSKEWAEGRVARLRADQSGRVESVTLETLPSALVYRTGSGGWAAMVDGQAESLVTGPEPTIFRR